MRRQITKLAAIALTIGTVASAVAPAAQAFEWAVHREIKSGQTIIGALELLSENEVKPAGSGIICPGIRGIGIFCPAKAENFTVKISEFNFFEPEAHNHSTFTSFFSARIN